MVIYRVEVHHWEFRTITLLIMYGLNVNFKTIFLDKRLKIWCEKKVGGGGKCAFAPPPLYAPAYHYLSSIIYIHITIHILIHWIIPQEYQCHMCDKSYPRADTLKRHILSFHEGKKMYKCNVCNKSFKGHIKVTTQL